ncbi:MAG TPA: beta-L-arabinofuranosidase domain-containing protein [Terracidiphilus sp.]|nr:beta-L-arabinofuranosidase domain-containing protein [Terracidiphilus sp.]
MNRRKFVKIAAFAPAAFKLTSSPALSQDTAPIAGQSGSQWNSSGWLFDRFELTLDRVLHGDSPAYTEEFVLADVRPSAERRFTEYSGDVSGRYIGALATAARVYGTDVPDLDALVAKVIVLQKPDGYFGSTFHYEKPTDADMALLWGNGRLLVGLLEYYELRKSAPVLASCRRIGDFLVRVAPMMLSTEIREAFGAQHFASSYICWTQQIEGLANLYRVTNDIPYRRLAEDIARVIERRAGDHVHGYLTSLRGVMGLYEATGDAQWLRQCEAAWEDITSSQDLLMTGGVPEGWSPNNHRTEGCGEADWVRLNLALWRATTEQKYLAMAERAIFNELAFNQYETGDFGHRLYTETGLPAAGAVRAWWCCTLHGLRCFPDIQESVFHTKDGALHYDLPLDGRIKVPALSVFAESSFAHDGSIRIMIEEAGNTASLLRMRKPPWAKQIEVSVNGSPVELHETNGYVSLERRWSAGDAVKLKYGMERLTTRVADDRVAFSHGPWLLGAAAADNPAYFNELTPQNKLLSESLSDVRTVRRPAQPFSVPIAATTFRYAQAEYPDQPAKVELRAIAEQTGEPTTSWELRFLTSWT